MPFTFKLSQRLARMRCAVLLLATAALAACEKPTGLTDPAGTLSQLLVAPKVLTLRPNQTADFMAVGLTNTRDTAAPAGGWGGTSGALTPPSPPRGRPHGDLQGQPQPGQGEGGGQ